MKLSELISEAEIILKEKGDLDVVLNGSVDGADYISGDMFVGEFENQVVAYIDWSATVEQRSLDDIKKGIFDF